MSNILGITKSKLRRKLISYFFTNSNANLYLREIAAFLNEDPGNLSKELARLEREGIFISARRGNQKYFSLNKEYPLYDELKSIVFKTIGVEGELKSVINHIDGVVLSFIYGSFASNRENNMSDIDLLVVGNPDEDKLMLKIDGLEKKIHREINYNIYSKEEFKSKIQKNNSFIINVLKGKKIILKGNINEI
ncbi:MAG: nucleotidyltransferase domain-containing protein [Candidatus Omnitrophota bacterium]